jgi:hypothetical protein
MVIDKPRGDDGKPMECFGESFEDTDPHCVGGLDATYRGVDRNGNPTNRREACHYKDKCRATVQYVQLRKKAEAEAPARNVPPAVATVTTTAPVAQVVPTARTYQPPTVVQLPTQYLETHEEHLEGEHYMHPLIREGVRAGLRAFFGSIGDWLSKNAFRSRKP